ncbi:MAG: hypothetical protein GY804_00930 [Alphaproteobacteria bacterium]|nr:hypothetical protein [Alphaproteobacteria bacterium]
MRKIFILLATVFVCVFSFVGEANALGIKKAHKKAKEYTAKIAKECAEEAFKNNPTSTADMRRAGHQDVMCLRDAAYKEADKIFEKEKLEEIKKEIEEARSNVGSLYWKIHNSHKGCGISCGTLYHVFHYGPQTRVLEKLIEDMASVRFEYEIK